MCERPPILGGYNICPSRIAQDNWVGYYPLPITDYQPPDMTAHCTLPTCHYRYPTLLSGLPTARYLWGDLPKGGLRGVCVVRQCVVRGWIVEGGNEHRRRAFFSWMLIYE